MLTYIFLVATQRTRLPTSAILGLGHGHGIGSIA